MPVSVKINSPRVTYDPEFIRSRHTYETSSVVTHPNGHITVRKLVLFYLIMINEGALRERGVRLDAG